ncbi:hypothetical protein RB597_001710 [Gaeumannomyces tritici]
MDIRGKVGDPTMWHLRLGHPGPEAMKDISGRAKGVRIAPKQNHLTGLWEWGPSTVKCDGCGKGKLKKQVSRRPRPTPTEPGSRLALDFIDVAKERDGFRSVLLITCRMTGLIWDFWMPNREAETVIQAADEITGLLMHQFNLKVRDVECDGELIKSKKIKEYFRSRHIEMHPSSAHTQAQNGGAERSNGVIVTKAAAMRSSAQLPRGLRKEVIIAAIYLNNRTSQRRQIPPEVRHGKKAKKVDWRSPYEKFHSWITARDGFANTDCRPQLGHLRVYGCKAFALKTSTLDGSNKLDKIKERAFIGFLVGYTATSIYRIWNPADGKVYSVRDVEFDEEKVYEGDEEAFALKLRNSNLTTEQIAENISRVLEQEADNRLSTSTPSNTGEDEEISDIQDNSDITPENGSTPRHLDSIFVRGGFGEDGSLIQDDPGQQNCDTEDVSLIQDEPGEQRCVTEDVSLIQDEPGKHSGNGESAPTTASGNGRSDPDPGVSREGDGVLQSGETDHPYTRARAEKFPNPSHSHPTPPPSPPTALLAGALAGTYDNVPKHSPIFESKRTTEAWEAAFTAARRHNLVGMRDGKDVSRDGLKRLLSSRHRRRHPLPGLSPETLDSLISNQRRGGGFAASTETWAALKDHVKAGGRVHRQNLPPPPKTHRDLHGYTNRKGTTPAHPLADWFITAEKDHLASHKETWLEVPRSQSYGHQVLGCMWVYVYKFNKHGYLDKVKARLVVRGDQQQKGQLEETYASTLAGRSFRTIIAMAAKFDLHMMQLDVSNAFVNAKLPHDIYMEMPAGYRKAGQVLKLLRALYGLRESPLLWQKEFSSTLSSFGFSPVPHEPCSFIGKGILIFFYVDDLVVVYRDSHAAEAKGVVSSLRHKYSLTGGDELQWFLGIRVLRDRQRRRIWLNQTSYIEKIHALAEDKKSFDTPMGLTELQPNNQMAEHCRVKLYQQKIGSILYVAIITRPDIAFAVSRLARFNANPSEEHHKAADRVLTYLYKTRHLALQYGGSDDFVIYSDASFADNSQNRKSSQAYVITLFGGIIGWRASKQATVTTSTTEAELLALAEAAKEALFVSRMIKELGVTLDDCSIKIKCDNQQTIGLVNKDLYTLQTKLRHVDIHNHWLRQEAHAKRINVTYTPTDQMLADGLTKALAGNKMTRFRNQLNLTDITQLLGSLKLPEMTDEELDKIEETLPGSEVLVE